MITNYDVLILNSDTKYFLKKDFKVRKLVMKGRNISLDLNSFTLFVKEIIVEGKNISIYSTGKSGNITNIFDIENGDIMKILTEIGVLYKDVNVLIAKRCNIPPIAVIFAKQITGFVFDNIILNTNVTAFEIINGTNIMASNSQFIVNKGKGISVQNEN